MLLLGLGGSVRRPSGYGLGTFLGKLNPASRPLELTNSSDFYENVGRYESSAAKAVVSHKVDETEAGQITTTMVVSCLLHVIAGPELINRRNSPNLSRTPLKMPTHPQRRRR
jgi:hypothetical protein